MPRPFLKTRAKETRSTARPRQVQGQVDVPFMLLTVLLVVIGLIMLLYVRNTDRQVPLWSGQIP